MFFTLGLGLENYKGFQAADLQKKLSELVSLIYNVHKEAHDFPYQAPVAVY